MSIAIIGGFFGAIGSAVASIVFDRMVARLYSLLVRVIGSQGA